MKLFFRVIKYFKLNSECRKPLIVTQIFMFYLKASVKKRIYRGKDKKVNYWCYETTFTCWNVCLASFKLTSVPHTKLKVKIELTNHQSDFLHYFIISLLFHYHYFPNWQKYLEVKVCFLNSVLILVYSFPDSKQIDILPLLLTVNIFNVLLIKITVK